MARHELIANKTGLQPVSRPVERILGFFPKVFKKGWFSKSLKMVLKVSFYVSKPLETL